MVAFGFFLSTLFKKVKTAVVVGYLYTIGTGKRLRQHFAIMRYFWCSC